MINSKISSLLKKRRLLRGSLIATPGILVLLIVGSFAPLAILERFGILSFCVGIFLISLGLIPYRRLCQLELKPHYIDADASNLKVLLHQRYALDIPMQLITACEWIEKKEIYGIGLHVKTAEIPKRFSRFGYACFLPFFKRDALDKLNECLAQQCRASE